MIKIDPNTNPENNINMLPSSPNIRPNSQLTNSNNNYNINEFNPHLQKSLQKNQNLNSYITSNNNQETNSNNFNMNYNNNTLNKNFKLNLNEVMKNNENYEMNLASNSNMGASSAQRDFYSQTQRSLMQNPMVLNPEQFNNSNVKSTKLNEITNSTTGISQEKLKDVIIYFI